MVTLLCLHSRSGTNVCTGVTRGLYESLLPHAHSPIERISIARLSPVCPASRGAERAPDAELGGGGLLLHASVRQPARVAGVRLGRRPLVGRRLGCGSDASSRCSADSVVCSCMPAQSPLVATLTYGLQNTTCAAAQGVLSRV